VVVSVDGDGDGDVAVNESSTTDFVSSRGALHCRVAQWRGRAQRPPWPCDQSVVDGHVAVAVAVAVNVNVNVNVGTPSPALVTSRVTSTSTSTST
jgi:hypothetical protein